MRNSLRAFVIVLVFTALGATTASGQSISVFANTTDLEDGGTMSTVDVQCIVERSGSIIFFNSEDQAIYSNDGTSTTVLRNSTDLNADVSGEQNGLDRCDGVNLDGSGNVYFLLRSDASSSTNSHPAYVYKLPASGSPSVLASANGLKGITNVGSTVYLAGVQFRGAAEDGIYSISSSGTGQSLNTVIQDSELDLSQFLEADSNGDLYAFSGGFADATNKENKIIQISDPNGTPSINIWADPYAGPFVNPGDGGIEDFEIVTRNGADRYYVYNASFNASDGEQFGVYQAGGTNPTVFTNQSDINTAIGNPITGGFTEPLAATSNGDLFYANRDGFGGVDQLIQIANAPLPVELTSFTVETDAQQAVLTWTTATETNNAGFEVQHQAPGAAAWSEIGFEQGAGTTTEARSYRFATDALQPGVHTFRLRQVDTDGTESFSDTRRVEIAAAQAVAFAGPNPVSAGDRPRVTVQLDRAQDVTIRVYNVLGQQVDQLYRGVLPAGEVLETSVSTANLPSGMYFLRVQGTSVNEVKKFTVVK
jgi:hypothetical protein